LYKFDLCFTGSSEDHLVPMLVNGLRGHHVIDVACGSGDAHSLAVADDGRWAFSLHCTSGSCFDYDMLIIPI